MKKDTDHDLALALLAALRAALYARMLQAGAEGGQRINDILTTLERVEMDLEETTS